MSSDNEEVKDEEVEEMDTEENYIKNKKIKKEIENMDPQEVCINNKGIKKEIENMDPKETCISSKEIKKETKSMDTKEIKGATVKMDIEETDVKSMNITKKENLTSYFEKKDHSVNQIYQSEVPKICKDVPCQLGVDEAGRGPVLGPMVYGIAYAPISKKQLLVDMGCADSKTLTENKRDIIFDNICTNCDKMGWAIEAISPTYIANCMYRRSKTSLNEVSMDSAIGLIKKTLEAGVNVTEIYVDTVGGPEKYQAKLKGIFPEIKITVAKKADSTYPIVSAASICAKVSRDHALRAWQFHETINGAKYGSGYPNDPATKTWLSDNIDPIFGFPQLVRFSWSTAEKILETKAVAVEWENREEESSTNEVKLSSFFAKSPARAKENVKPSHAFFSNRCLMSTTKL